VLSGSLILLCSACGEDEPSSGAGATDAGSGGSSSGDAGGECETHSECPASSPYCSPERHSCMQCGGDFSCPAETPICVSHWEDPALKRCVECLVGSSETCPVGEYCVGGIAVDPAGRCETADCAVSPASAGCEACQKENSAPCLDAGGQCATQQAALNACLGANAPLQGCDPEPAYYRTDCIPAACLTQASDVKDCVATCTSVVTACS
jgi:hypothetical protein